MKTKHRKTKNKNLECAFNLMPADSNSQAILRERSTHFAKAIIKEVEHVELVSYIRFRLGETENYGISYHYTNEVLRNTPLTKIPFAPAVIAGVINHRGALLSILNLKQLFFGQDSPYDKNSSIIILSCQGMTLGILVDNIVGNYTYEANSLDAVLPTEGSIKQHYLFGLHSGKTALINIEAIMSDIQADLQRITQGDNHEF